jgi:hypothetical protein
MGTIKIEQYGSVGSAANRDAPVVDLNTCLATTEDTSTSTTVESVVLGLGTRVVTVVALEGAHRISVLSSDCSNKYATVADGATKDVGVNPGQTLYYRADA